MRPRFPASFSLAVVALLCTTPAPSAFAQPEHRDSQPASPANASSKVQLLDRLPESNPYKPALVAYARLAAAVEAAEQTGSAPPSDAARATAFDTITRSLAAGRAAAEVDWGVDYTQGLNTALATILAHIQPAARLGRELFAELPAPAEPAARADLALGLLGLGRHLGREGYLIQGLSGIAIAKSALAALDPLVAQLTPDQRARLSAEIARLPPPPDLATALAYEKAFILDTITRQLADELATALGQAPSSATDSAKPDALARFLDNLTLHGLVQECAVTRVGLRYRDELFWLGPGETRRGVTLLSASVAAGHALLRIQDRPVLLNLNKGSFSVPALDILETAARVLPPDSLCAYFISTKPDGTLADFFADLETSTRQLSELYADAINHPERITNEAEFNRRLEQLSPTAKRVAPELPRLIGLFADARARETAFRAKLVPTPDAPVAK